MRNWTDETTEAADEFYRTLSEAEIRRRQDLTNQQILMAFEQKNEDALHDLRSQEDALREYVDHYMGDYCREYEARFIGGKRETIRDALMEHLEEAADRFARDEFGEATLDRDGN